MTKTLHLTNNINQIPLLAEWTEQLADECQLPADKAFQLNLALEEAVANVMLYAYPDQQDMPIVLTAEIMPDCIVFVLSDQGIPFDPTQAKDPDLTLSAEDRPIGGLGIMLVRQFMKDIVYSYENGCNRLQMTLETVSEVS